MKTNEIRLLLEQLLSITQDLQIKVLRDSDNIDGWTCLIYKREEIIEQISSLQQQGETISDENKMDYLKKVYEIDQQLFPLIEQKYDDLDRQSKNIQKVNMWAQNMEVTEISILMGLTLIRETNLGKRNNEYDQTYIFMQATAAMLAPANQQPLSIL